MAGVEGLSATLLTTTLIPSLPLLEKLSFACYMDDILSDSEDEEEEVELIADRRTPDPFLFNDLAIVNIPLSCKTIKKLALSNLSHAMLEVFGILEGSSEVEEVYISKTIFATMDHTHQFHQLLERKRIWRYMTTLHVASNLITNGSIRLVGLYSPCLTSLCLENTKKVTDEGLFHIQQTMKQLTILGCISIPKLTDIGIQALGGSTNCLLERLHTLDIGGCPKLTVHGMRTIFTHCTQLQRLQLDMTYLEMNRFRRFKSYHCLLTIQ